MMKQLDHTQDEIAQLRQENAQLREERDYWRKQFERTQAVQRVARNAPQTPGEDDAVQEVFATWQRLFGYPNEKLTKLRRVAILAGLRSGRTVEEIHLVLGWASTDPWTRGTDPNSKRAWDDLTSILQPSKFDQRLLLARTGSRKATTKSAALLGGQGKPVTIRTLGQV